MLYIISSNLDLCLQNMSNTYYLNYLANVEMSINYTDNPISLRSQFYMIYQNSATFNLFGMESNFSVHT